jgi:DNA-binding SARP family transcriptional activator
VEGRDDDVIVRLLGPLEVVDPSRTAELGTRERALLAALALSVGEQLSFDALIGAIWGELAPRTAKKTLQGHVLRLRRAAPSLDLVTTPAGYRLELGRIDVDAHRFDDAVHAAEAVDDPGRRLAELDAALSLWRGQALSGVEAPYFDAARVRLDERRRSAQEARCRCQIELGRFDAAVRDLEDLVRSDPYREMWWGLLMVALYAAGRRADALRSFQRARTLLVTELGVDPGPDLTAIEAAVLTDDTEALRRVAPGPAVGAARTTARSRPIATLPTGLTLGHTVPLVGRLEELTEIESRCPADGSTAWVSVAGPPGIGKSRLLAEAAQRLQAVGRTVYYGWCDQTPWGLGPIRSLVSQLPTESEGRDDPWVRQVRSLLRMDEAAAASSIELVDARAQLVESCVGLLADQAGPVGTVVVIDDVQWLDADSASLLRAILRHPACPGLVLLTAERLSLPVGGTGTPLAELRSSIDCSIVEVGPLAEAEVGTLIHHLPALRFDGRSHRRIVELAEGVPFFALQLAAATTSDRVPTALREALLTRLGELDLRRRDQIEPLAVLGRGFSVDLASRISELDRQELLGVLDGAVQAGVLVERSVGEFQWRHALLRQVALESLTATRIVEHHAHIWRCLRDLPTEHPDLIADHGLAADGWIDAAELVDSLLASADALLAGLSVERAAVVAEEAAARASGSEEAAWRSNLLVGRARLLSDEDAGRAALDRATELALEAQRPDWVATTALAQVGRNLSYDRRLVDRLQSAIDVAPDHEFGTRAMLLTRLATETIEYEASDDARRWAAEAVELAERSGDPLVLAHALHAVQVTDRLCAPTERLLLADRIDGLGQELDRLVDTATSSGWSRWHGACVTMQATVALARGAEARFEELSQQALAINRSAGLPDADGIRSAQVFALTFQRGEIGGLAPLIEPLVEQYDSSPVWRTVYAASLAEGGDPKAESVLAGLDETTMPKGILYLCSLALTARAAAQLGATDRFAGLASALEPFRGRQAVAGLGLAIFGAVDDFLTALC